VIEVGDTLRIRVLATPGHTFTHLSYALEADGGPRRLYKEHLGRRRVESDVGRGTTFRVYWPLAASSSQMLTAVGRG